jgi:U5 small nuclear ribonucleoprotein component
VQFILEPFYKLVSVSVSEEKSELERILKKEAIVLKKKEFDLDIKPLVKLILSKFFGDLSCLVDCLATLPNAKAGTVSKVGLTYPGDGILKCESQDKLCV